MPDLASATTEELVAELSRRGNLPRCRCQRWKTYVGSYDRDGLHLALPGLPACDRQVHVPLTP